MNPVLISYGAGLHIGIKQARAGLPPISFAPEVPRDYVDGCDAGYETFKLAEAAKI